MGKPIEGATIKLKGTRLGGVSSGGGMFLIQNIEAGNYTLITTSVGYDTGRAIVTVQPNYQTEISLSLLQRVAAAAEELAKKIHSHFQNKT